MVLEIFLFYYSNEESFFVYRLVPFQKIAHA